jgi:hypothetical protein
MIFQGAITGLGMFVALYVLFSWYPKIKSVLFGLGGIFDIGVSFGLPLVLTNVMGIKGGTMLIATLTCGLLFTFTLATKRLGGAVRAATSSTKTLVSDTLASFEAWKKEGADGKRNPLGNRGTEPGHRTRSGGKREENTNSHQHQVRSRDRGVIDLDKSQYTIS